MNYKEPWNPIKTAVTLHVLYDTHSVMSLQTDFIIPTPQKKSVTFTEYDSGPTIKHLVSDMAGTRHYRIKVSALPCFPT